MTEEIKNPSNLDTEGVKQERIKIDIEKVIIHPSRFVKKHPTKGSHIRVSELGEHITTMEYIYPTTKSFT